MNEENSDNGREAWDSAGSPSSADKNQSGADISTNNDDNNETTTEKMSVENATEKAETVTESGREPKLHREGKIERSNFPTTSSPSTSSSAQVLIHNIRSSLPEPEIEMLYTVYQSKFYFKYCC